jgi:hypothetical protein
MKSKLIICMAYWLCHLTTYSQTILSPGDVVVVYYKFKTSDEIQLLFRREIQAGTIFYITDAGYMPVTNQLKKGEGYLKFVASQTYNAGQSIIYPTEPGFTKVGVDGFYGLNQTGDQITIYQGSFESPQFIFSLNISSDDWLSNDAVANTNSGLPQGLIDGITALRMSNYPVGVIQCPTSTKLADINYFTSSTNWSQSNNESLITYSNCDFSTLSQANEPPISIHELFIDDVRKSTIISIEIYDLHGKKVYVCNTLEEAYYFLPEQQLFLIKVIESSRIISYKIIKQ